MTETVTRTVAVLVHPGRVRPGCSVVVAVVVAVAVAAAVVSRWELTVACCPQAVEWATQTCLLVEVMAPPRALWGPALVEGAPGPPGCVPMTVLSWWTFSRGLPTTPTSAMYRLRTALAQPTPVWSPRTLPSTCHPWTVVARLR
jgi:hypothetical protein